MNPDGEDWRRGYDDWKAEPPAGEEGECRPCAVCGATKRKLPVSMACVNGHSPAEMDRAAKAARGW